MEQPNQKIDPYKIVKERTLQIIDFLKDIKVSYSMTEKDLNDLKLKLKNHLESLPNSSLNPNKENLLTHIELFEGYLRKLYQYDKFRQLIPQGVSENFIYSLAWLHDLTRFFYNGPFPLYYIDWINDSLLRKVYPEIQWESYMHDFDWIIGKKETPDDKNQITLILKAIDSLAKPGRRPSEFLSGNQYDQWLEIQISKGNLPLRYKRLLNNGCYQEIIINPQDYKNNDLNLITRGLNIIQSITDQEPDRFFVNNFSNK